jgi:hypothetical protein
MSLPPGSPSGHARAFALASVLFLLATPAFGRDWGQPLFEWTDPNGVVRYTAYPDRVPGESRGSLREIRHHPTDADGAPPVLGSFDRTGVAQGDDDGTGTTPGVVPGYATGVPGGTGAPSARERSALDREIAALEAKITRDQEVLKTLISDPEAAPELSTSADLATIASRLPKQQAELRELRTQREREREGEARP